MLSKITQYRKLILGALLAGAVVPASAWEWPELPAVNWAGHGQQLRAVAEASWRWTCRHAGKLSALALAGAAYHQRDNLADRWERATETVAGKVGGYAAAGAVVLGVGYYLMQQMQRAREFDLLEAHYLNIYTQSLKHWLTKHDTYFPWGAWAQSPQGGILGLRRAADSWVSVEELRTAFGGSAETELTFVRDHLLADILSEQALLTLPTVAVRPAVSRGVRPAAAPGVPATKYQIMPVNSFTGLSEVQKVAILREMLEQEKTRLESFLELKNNEHLKQALFAQCGLRENGEYAFQVHNFQDWQNLTGEQMTAALTRVDDQHELWGTTKTRELHIYGYIANAYARVCALTALVSRVYSRLQADPLVGRLAQAEGPVRALAALQVFSTTHVSQLAQIPVATYNRLVNAIQDAGQYCQAFPQLQVVAGLQPQAPAAVAAVAAVPGGQVVNPAPVAVNNAAGAQNGGN